jgi:ribosome-associated toxin RatA of RatAB toxin-antitoxin module
MLSGERSLAIDAAPGAVLAVVADVEAYPHWHPFFESVRATRRDHSDRVVSAACRHNASVTTLSTTLEFTYRDDAVAARRTDGDMRELEGVFEIREQDGIALVTHRLHVDPGLKLGLLLRGPVEDRVRERVIGGALEGLSERVSAARG